MLNKLFTYWRYLLLGPRMLTPFFHYIGVSLYAPESLWIYIFLTLIGLLLAFLMIWGGGLAQVLPDSFFIILKEPLFETDELIFVYLSEPEHHR
jgi:hypothetical protein